LKERYLRVSDIRWPEGRSEAEKWNRALDELVDIGAAEEELQGRYFKALGDWRDGVPTLPALVANWNALAPWDAPLSLEERQARHLQSLRERGVA
jgi:hypothetical protein